HHLAHELAQTFSTTPLTISPPAPGDEGRQRLDARSGAKELDMTVGEDRVGSAGMKAVNCVVVGAVEGTRSRPVLAVEGGAFRVTIETGPRPALDHPSANWGSSLPPCRPAGNFGEHDGVRGAIRYFV